MRKETFRGDNNHVRILPGRPTGDRLSSSSAVLPERIRGQAVRKGSVIHLRKDDGWHVPGPVDFHLSFIIHILRLAGRITPFPDGRGKLGKIFLEWLASTFKNSQLLPR